MPYIADKEWQRMANFLGRVRETDDAFPGRVGEVAVFDFQGKHPVSDLHSFDGKVYVITGWLSYSSAIMFAGIIQDNELGQIVGKTTEARSCSTGMPLYHDMPVTGLLAFTPQHWYQRNTTQSCIQGVKADIDLPEDPFNPDHLVDLLVEQITNNKQ
jgi:C-terminal processing protease CtpA/Prc